MIEILEFILSTPTRFWEVILLLAVIGHSIRYALKDIRLIEIKYIEKQEDVDLKSISSIIKEAIQKDDNIHDKT